MKLIIKSTLAILLFVMPTMLMAQKGTIRGQVLDGENAEPLFAANAVVKGTQIGATTDFDGFFELMVEPGTYQLEISFIGMTSLTITDVKVSAGEVTVIDPISLEPASSQLAEVVVTSEAVRNSEAAIVTVKRKSTNLIDGVSAAKLRKTGDSDAGDAAKRVTGVSVEGGKYVYVRGLGDRYTKTMLNGVDVPGLDPDKNSIQIDIFPTNLISNLTVLKSGLAELPADFTGGVVNIETQEFPSKKILDVSVGISYNPDMHFNPDYIAYEGGSTDFLGFDDGTRAIPDPNGLGARPLFDSDQEAESFNQSFNRTLGAETSTSIADYSFGVTFGDQISLESGDKLGYIASLTYDNSRLYYDEMEFGEFQRAIPADETELVAATTQVGKVAEQNVLLGGLAGISYKTLKAKYKLTLMHLQNGSSRSAQLNIRSFEDIPGISDYRAFSHNLEYNQRGLSNVLLAGEHFLDGGDWEVNWKLSPTISTLSDPDIRKTAFSISQSDSAFDPGEGGLPSRLWRSLSEINNVAKVDVIRSHDLWGNEAKLKFGASHTYKYRDYTIYQYNLNELTSSLVPQIDLNGDPNAVLSDQNLYSYNPTADDYIGFWYNPTLEPGFANPNEYQSSINNFGFYASEEFKPINRLKAVVGLRAELFQQRHTGRDQDGANPNSTEGNVLDNELVLDALDLFPSANLIYAVNEDMNLRASYFRSIARPSFKELSFAQILDPVSNRTFNGGLFVYDGDWDGDLVSTRIHNFDLRWEKFLEGADIVSLSAFFKSFDAPIELVRIPTSQTLRDIQPRNVGQATLIGGEFELRKNLSFIRENWKRVAFSGNFTYTYSRVKMADVEFQARQNFEKEGETVDDTRQMAGQAPYIVNAGFSYDDIEKGRSAGIFYNVKGRTLTIVGSGLAPDIYSEPFHSLNFTYNQSFGKDRRSSINIKVNNILNDVREQLYQAYEAEAQAFLRFRPGTAISIGYTYSFY